MSGVFIPTALELVHLVFMQLVNVTMYFKNRRIKAVLFVKCGFATTKDLPTTAQRFHSVHIKNQIKSREVDL